MQRVLLVAAGMGIVFAGCDAPVPFKLKRTPSGGLCSAMPIYRGNEVAEQEFRRIVTVWSDPKLATDAARLESLRKAACAAGADAIIEAREDAVFLADATRDKLASGTAVVWTPDAGASTKPPGLGTVQNKPGEEGAPQTQQGPKDPVPLDTPVEGKSPPSPPAP